MTSSLISSGRTALERYLTYGVRTQSRERVLMIRRARGFGLIGFVVAFLAGFVTGVANGVTDLVVASLGLMFFIVAGLWAGYIRESRYIVPVTHLGLGAILGGIFLTSIWVPAGTEISVIFPMLLILVLTYVLGVKAAFYWSVATVIGSAVTITYTQMPEAVNGIAMSKAGLFALRAVAIFGAFGFAAAERRVVDRQSQELEFLAGHDSLTGLLNRRAFEERFDAALARARRYDRRVALIMIDLDRFKPVNDIHGHAVGDEVLRRLAHRIARLTRETDAVCRLGGDEFVVLVEDMREEKHLQLHASRLLETLSRPMDLDELKIQVGASIGIAIQSGLDDDAVLLMRTADQAMYAAKSAGGTTIRSGDVAQSDHPPMDGFKGLGV
jgi:diguanylate cyclase (GGDEF)-like protein